MKKILTVALMTALLLAIATSIDALAVGVPLELQGANILIAAPLIAVITGVLSPVGLKVGNVFGARYKSRAELVGGIVLVITCQLFPLVFLYINGALKNIDNSLIEASSGLGCSSFKLFLLSAFFSLV